MKKYRDKHLRGRLLLLIAIIGGAVLWICARGAGLLQYRSNLAGEAAAVLGTEEFQLAVVSTIKQEDMESHTIIKWWNDGKGKRYLFLPKAWKEEGRSIWTFTNADEIQLDDTIIRNGDECDAEEGTYTLKANGEEYPLTVMYSGDIASLHITTDSGSLDFIHADKANSEGAGFVLHDQNGALNQYGRMDRFNCRGNATFQLIEGKKSYHMKLQTKSSLLGLREERDWILLANAYDRTLSRNVLAHELAQRAGLAYTPAQEYVDLYINGEYRGNYLLSEQIEVGSNRVNIRDLNKETELLNPGLNLADCEQVIEDPDKLYSRKWFKIPSEPEECSGGYLMEIEWADRYGAEPSGFITSRMQAVVLHNPKYAGEKQIGYIADLYQDFEDALFDEDGYNENTGKYFYDYIDMESFVTKYMVEELIKNLDASYTSCYLYKPQNGDRMYAGPMWDYDSAIYLDWITDEGIDLSDPEGLYVAIEKRDADLWYGLYQQSEFRRHVDEACDEKFKKNVVDFANEFVMENVAGIADSALMDDVLWDRLEAEGTEAKEALFHQYNQELADFLLARMEYLDREWEYSE